MPGRRNRTERDEQAIQDVGSRVREEYAYMDNMPFEGYMWEMIRRTREYRDLFLNCRVAAGTLGDEYNEGFISNWDRQFRSIGLDVICDTNVRRRMYVIIGNRSEKHLAIPRNHPYVKFRDFPPSIVGTRLVKSIGDMRSFLRNFLNEDKEFGKDGLVAFLKALSPITVDKTICLAISTIGDKTIIKKEIDIIIKRNVKTPRSRKRNDKWKLYLIAYDLNRKSYNKIEIADIFQVAYPDIRIPNTIDESNIDDFLYQAHRLIEHGDYKKYIHR